MRTQWAVAVIAAVILLCSGPCVAVDHRTAAVTAGIPCARANIRYHGGEILYDSTKGLSITGTVDGKPPDAAAVARLTAMAERVQGVINRLADCSPLRDPSNWPWVLYSGGELEGNAFCHLAGAIGISRGVLMETGGDDDYLAFWLAHEMSHYINGDQGKDPEGPLNEDDVLAQLRATGFTRRPRGEALNSERMADMAGISLMHQAGYDAMAALRLTDDQLRELGALCSLPFPIGALVSVVTAPVMVWKELTDDHGFLVQRRTWLSEGVRLALNRPPTAEAEPWQRQGTKVGEEITGPDGGTYVWVPPGEFMMGSEDGGDAEKPVHRVRITKGFWLSKCEVTNAQYRRFCEATGREFPGASDQGDPHPIDYLRWEDARAYCDHHGLRLPTEAEWEYSARGSKGVTYPWGNQWDAKRCCFDENPGPNGRTFPVGSFASGASWCGALDLTGNVWEWCADWYAEDYYSHSPVSDAKGPQNETQRVIRGGGWGSRSSRYCRAAFRSSWYPDFRAYLVSCGFRPAASPR